MTKDFFQIGHKKNALHVTDAAITSEPRESRRERRNEEQTEIVFSLGFQGEGALARQRANIGLYWSELDETWLFLKVF